MSKDVREQLAALAHEQWSGWMKHLFSKSLHQAHGPVVITKPYAERWKRQMDTPYADLPEEEKESDRKEAERVMALLNIPRKMEREPVRIKDFILLEERFRIGAFWGPGSFAVLFWARTHYFGIHLNATIQGAAVQQETLWQSIRFEIGLWFIGIGFLVAYDE